MKEPQMSASMKKDEEEWAAKRDLETLVEAERIKNDKDRLKRAMAKHAEMKKAILAIKG